MQRIQDDCLICGFPGAASPAASRTSANDTPLAAGTVSSASPGHHVPDDGQIVGTGRNQRVLSVLKATDFGAAV